MARLESIAKLGYYPCPPQTLASIISYLKPVGNKPITLLDPCAGQGEALASIAKSLDAAGGDAHTYGVEVADSRAPIAKKVIHNFVHSDWESVMVSNNAFSMLYLNPPYDTEIGGEGERKVRLEYKFLRNCIRALQPGGLLIYIIPLTVLGHGNIARSLSSAFSNVKVFKLPEEEFQQFGQIVLFGYKHEHPVTNKAMAENLKAYASGAKQLPELGSRACRGTEFKVPPAAKKPDKIILRKIWLKHEEIVEAAQTSGVLFSKEWQRFTRRETNQDFRPVVPMRTGHLGALISSGQMGIIHLPNQENPTESLIAKGYAVKIIKMYDADNNVLDPNKLTPEQLAKRLAFKRESIQTRVYTLRIDGHHEEIMTPQAMEDFLRTHATAIAKIIEKRYKPLYETPTQQEWNALAPLLRHKRLPGRKEGGLLPAQKHSAIAALRSIQHQGWADLIGMMGTGKTTMGTAVAHLLDTLYGKGFPAIVICPGHLTQKWAREIKDVLGVNSNPVIIENTRDIVTFHNQHPQPEDCPPRTVLIISKERIKLGAGWTPVTIIKKLDLPITDPNGNVLSMERTDVHHCPKCGNPLRTKNGAVRTGKLPNKRLFCEHKENEKNSDEQPCGEPLYEYALRVEGGKKKPLGNNLKFRRWPVALYIKKKMRNYFALLLADEFHQYKGKSTDQARAYHLIADACKSVLNLTGTLFGGKSTDLLWLRHRIDEDVRTDYEFHDEMKWAADYGRLEYTFNTVDEEENEDGTFSGQTRHVTTVKEIPGISPKLFGRLLKSCIFLKIEELGVQMPDYDEHIIHIDMTPTQKLQYKWLNEQLLDHIQSCFESQSKQDRLEAQKLLSVWLQNVLCRPNSCFRPELIKWKPPILDELQKLKQTEETHLPYTVYDIPDFAQILQNNKRYPNGQCAICNKTEADCEGCYGEVDLELQRDKGERWDWLEIPTDEDEEVHTDPLGTMKEEFKQTLARAQKLLDDFDISGEPMHLVPVIESYDELLPKEQWLVDYVCHEKEENRKVVIYIRQTGKRNIQPRIEYILRLHGINAIILPDTVKPANREKWINKNVQKIDALIVNARKVETGLDLVAFSTGIFYEIEYSLFTVWQALYRLWRLGQENGVKMLFPVYRGTMEAAALNLMGQKMSAALLLYGDNASSAIADGGGDFLAQLANKVLAGEQLESNGVTGLLAQAIPEGTEETWQNMNIVYQEEQPTPAPELAEGIPENFIELFLQETNPLTQSPIPSPQSPIPSPKPAQYELWEEFIKLDQAARYKQQPLKEDEPNATQLSFF